MLLLQSLQSGLDCRPLCLGMHGVLCVMSRVERGQDVDIWIEPPSWQKMTQIKLG